MTETTTNCGKPQQKAGYARLAAVASPASCEQKPIRILRLPEVIARVGYRRASIYQFVSKGTFPKPIALGARAVGWLEHEIDAWLLIRIQARQVNRTGGAYASPF